MKKGIIVILAILITVGAGITVPIMMRSGPEDPIKDKTGEATAEIKTPIVVSTDSATGNNVLITPAVPTDTKYKSDVSLEISTPTVVPKTTAETSPEPGGAVNTAVKPTPTAKENSQSGSWVERKIQEHRDEIDDDDLEDFRRIYSLVDIGYIQSLTNDGLSAEETEQLKAYLKSKLGGDYERAKELFYEYSYLMSEV